MQRWFGLVLSKQRMKSRCVLWAMTCQLAFPFPQSFRNMSNSAHASWATSTVLVLSCLNVHSAGVQNILATYLPAASHFSKKKNPPS